MLETQTHAHTEIKKEILVSIIISLNNCDKKCKCNAGKKVHVPLSKKDSNLSKWMSESLVSNCGNDQGKFKSSIILLFNMLIN